VVEAAALSPEEERRYALGAKIYLAICENCHQPDGRGKDKVAKPLAGSRFLLANPGIPARIVAYGMEGATGLMPPQGNNLSDEQIASVLTWVRRQWGNNGSAVDPADVKEARGLSSNRKQPWKEDEIARLVGGGRGGAGGPGAVPGGRGNAGGRGPAGQ
jgi:mono/diheme cytochrome c family protein